MFLLKRESKLLNLLIVIIFTFHNVSIKTVSVDFRYNQDSVFTFHNVSIKTNNTLAK